MIEAYPLCWPIGRKKTDNYSRESSRFRISFAKARDEITHEVDLLCKYQYLGANLIISTNVPLRRDGLPLANQKTPEDSGVAIYFTYKKRQMSFCCDRWKTVEDNMQAIAKTIGALRGIARWGTGDMLEAAFTGFMALGDGNTPKNWWEELGISDKASLEELKTAYRRKALEFHPDKYNGNAEKFKAINRAYEQGLLSFNSN